MLLDLFSVEYGTVVSAIDTHDGANKKRRYIDEKELKALNKVLLEREQQKVEARNLLHAQIDKIIHGNRAEVAEAVEHVHEELPEIEVQGTNKREIVPALKEALASIERQITLLQEEARVNMLEARRLREEEEIQVIMMALDAPIREFFGTGKTHH